MDCALRLPVTGSCFTYLTGRGGFRRLLLYRSLSHKRRHAESFCLTDSKQNCPRVPAGGNMANSRIMALDPRRVVFNTFKVLLGRISWEAVLDGCRRWMHKS